jgi:hypothetical protein
MVQSWVAASSAAWGWQSSKSGHGFPAMILSISTKSVDFFAKGGYFMTVKSGMAANLTSRQSQYLNFRKRKC